MRMCERLVYEDKTRDNTWWKLVLVPAQHDKSIKQIACIIQLWRKQRTICWKIKLSSWRWQSKHDLKHSSNNNIIEKDVVNGIEECELKMRMHIHVDISGPKKWSHFVSHSFKDMAVFNESRSNLVYFRFFIKVEITTLIQKWRHAEKELTDF